MHAGEIIDGYMLTMTCVAFQPGADEEQQQRCNEQQLAKVD